MKSEELLYSMEHVGSDLLAAAEQTVLVRKHTSWVKTAAAAVLALAVGVGGFLLLKNLHANNDPVPATNPSTVENHTTEATETQNHDTVIDPLSLVGESLSESGSYTDSLGNQTDYSYELPCINADTEGAKAINEDIEQIWGNVVREAHEVMEQKSSLIDVSIDYKATAWNDILSLKLHENTMWAQEFYRIYNYECSTGRWLTTQELLDRMEISEEDFRQACRTQFAENEYHEPDGSIFFFDDDEMILKDGKYYRSRNKGTSDEKLAEVEVHPYQDGRVEVIAPISQGAGAAYYYYELLLDLSPEHEPETTEEQDADALRAELDALFAVDESHMGQNFYHQALTSAYESPENVKLYQLFHSGTDTDYVESAEEKAKLDEAFPMQFDRVRVSVGEMNGILNQVFGIGFEQVNGHQAFLDNERNVYLPETDSYYWECTDANWLYGFSIQDVRTLEDGRVLFTYHRELFWDAPEGIWTVCLKKDNGVYHIISNLPGEWVTEKAEQETTEEQDADALRAELEALFRDEDCDNLNPYVRALTCYYESPALVDFFEFFYNGFGREVYEDKETLEMLKTKYPDYFGDGHLHTDCDCLTEAEMDEVLRQVFGVGIDQTEKRNLDRFVYIPETDTYYHQHGDTNALGTSPLIQDVRTEEDGLVLFTYKISLDRGFEEEGKFSNIRTVALKKENGVYHIVSHLPGEFTTAGDLALAPCTDWRMEAEAGDEGPDVRELKVSSTMRYFYQAGDQDSEFNYWCEGSIVYQEDGTLQINIYEIPEDGSIGARTGEPSFDATYACTRENGTIVLTQLSDEGFYNDPKGTVLRFAPDTED